MPVMVCSDCGETQRLDTGEFVACRYCASSNMRPANESSGLSAVDG